MQLLVWPREHGAWGILGVAFLTGAAVSFTPGSPVAPLLLFALAVLALFCLRTPVVSLLGTAPLRAQTATERRRVWSALTAFASVALLSLTGLFWGDRNRGLLGLGAVCGLLFLAQILLSRFDRRARMAAQLVGALGLTSTAAGACYVVAGRFDFTALALWLANWMFAANQIHFVQLRIHHAHLASRKEKFAAGRVFFFGQFLTLLVLAWGVRGGLLPDLALAAFIPVSMRGLRWFIQRSEPLRVHRLGFTELAHALVFGLLLIASYRVI
jgi:hypothetical protein